MRERPAGTTEDRHLESKDAPGLNVAAPSRVITSPEWSMAGGVGWRHEGLELRDTCTRDAGQVWCR